MLWMVLGGVIACMLALAHVSHLMKQNQYGQSEHLSEATSPPANTAADAEISGANRSLDRS